MKGDSFDGHKFLGEAENRGALALISEMSVPAKIPVIVVKDTLQALVAIGTALRNEFTGKIIAVTGSAGKSSTKEMLAALLAHDTVASPASFNNLMGVSRTMCLVGDSTRQLVLEMGMNDFGEIAELCECFRPHAGIITNIGDAHIGKLGGKEGIFRAKKELFDFLAQSGRETLLGVGLNLDDSLVEKAYQETFKAPISTVTYSLLKEDAEVRVLKHGMDPETGFLHLKMAVREEAFDVQLPLFGLHQAQNVAAATAGALLMGESLADIRGRYANIRAASHRGEIHRLPDDRILIDESYNSNPTALLSALASLMGMSPRRRRVLVLGDMFELGDFSDRLHTEVGTGLGKFLEKTPASVWLIGVGTAVGHLIRELKLRFPALEAVQVAKEAEVMGLLKPKLATGDVILVKGSRGVRLDRVADALKG